MSVSAVVLAAGQGTRFRSGTAKVLHPVCGWSLLRWVLEALRPLALERIVVVVGHQAEEVTAEALRAGLPNLTTVVQSQQLGTGHAVRHALPRLDTSHVLVVPGDTPLLTGDVLRPLLASSGPSMLTTELVDPSGYGRVLRDSAGRVVGVVEDRDATEAQRAIREVNTSIYVFSLVPLRDELDRLEADNAQGEEYLTDVIAPLSSQGLSAVCVPADDVTGVNDRVELARAGAVLRRRMLERMMLAGVTVIDPAATYVDATVQVDPDALLLPGTHLEGETEVGAGAEIGPNTRLVDTRVGERAQVAYSVADGAEIGPDVHVGPFTYLRPGTRLEAGSKAGAFVEMKNSRVGEGSKVPHLSYIGDTTIGRGSNIGAATVTVNYDGYAKHPTVIGDGAFVGSDTMLVAPVTIGDGAVTGAGSVITKDVPDGALAVERSEQRIVPGYAERRRAKAQRAKDP